MREAQRGENGNRDYVLGTGVEEIERLGLQHRMWRPRTLECWQRAGVSAGASVLDVGAGPGHASLDLAKIVGPTGRVTAVERSRRFAEELTRQLEESRLQQVVVVEADVTLDPLPRGPFDFAWCRWVACFVSNPRVLVRQLAEVLRPGGFAIFHEYSDYASWRLLPRNEPFERFVELVMRSWHEAGGEPDIGLKLPSLLQAERFDVREITPIIHCVVPGDDLWLWLAAFVDAGLARLVELELASAEWAGEIRESFKSLEAAGGAHMLTPTVLEIVAERRPSVADSH